VLRIYYLSLMSKRHDSHAYESLVHINSKVTHIISMRTSNSYAYALIERTPPPRRICTRGFEGGPLPPGSWLGNIVKLPMYSHAFTYIQKRPNIFKNDVIQKRVPPGSWLGDIVNWKPPRGGGGLFEQLEVYKRLSLHAFFFVYVY